MQRPLAGSVHSGLGTPESENGRLWPPNSISRMCLAEEELRGTYNQDPAEDGQSYNREQCGDNLVSEFFSLMH